MDMENARVGCEDFQPHAAKPRTLAEIMVSSLTGGEACM
jgi:hypothetical protein